MTLFLQIRYQCDMTEPQIPQSFTFLQCHVNMFNISKFHKLLISKNLLHTLYSYVLLQ